MTRAQMRRAAREARRLAMEVVAGAAPPMAMFTIQDATGARCAVAEWAHRSGIEVQEMWLPTLLHPAALDVMSENNTEGQHGLPWALLALADALDEASASAPARSALPAKQGEGP